MERGRGGREIIIEIIDLIIRGLIAATVTQRKREREEGREGWQRQGYFNHVISAIGIPMQHQHTKSFFNIFQVNIQ